MVEAVAKAVSLSGLCPVCQELPGMPCSVPTISGRRAVNWFHYGRYEAGLAEMRRTNG
jgi:hypothetical protein